MGGSRRSIRMAWRDARAGRPRRDRRIPLLAMTQNRPAHGVAFAGTLNSNGATPCNFSTSIGSLSTE